MDLESRIDYESPLTFFFDRPVPPVSWAGCGGEHSGCAQIAAPGDYCLLECPFDPARNRAEANGAYVFAWGFGFIQLLLEFGMGTALQRQMTVAWTRGDRDGVNRLVAGGMAFYTAMAVIQMILLLAIAYFGLPASFRGRPRRLIVGLLWIQALSAPFYGLVTVASCVLQAASRYEIVPRLDLVLMIVRFVILILGLRTGVDFIAIVASQTIIVPPGCLYP